MRVVEPAPLLLAAADVLGPIKGEVVVVGGLAVEIALSGSGTALTPTTDIDAGALGEDVASVVSHLEGRGFERSTLPHERAFTWVNGQVKVQLMRPFHPFPPEVAKGLPENNLVSDLATNKWEVALSAEPEVGILWSARPAALIALKELAFGRERYGSEGIVDRDFSDAAMILDHHRELILRELSESPQLRQRVARAATRLVEDPMPAAREMLATGQVATTRAGEAMVARIARETLADLGVHAA